MSVYRCAPGALLRGGVPIGQPMGGAEVYLLTAHGGLAGVGEPGEIHFGGPFIARGYLGDAQLTAAKFVTEREHGLTLAHFGSTAAMGWSRYRRKMVRGAFAYSHTARASIDECKGKYGEHYCKFWFSLHALGETRSRSNFYEARERAHLCNGTEVAGLSNAVRRAVAAQ